MKRALVASLLVLVGCNVVTQFLEEPLIWPFERRAEYQFPDDDAAATRELVTMTTADDVRIKGLWLPAPATAAPCRPAIAYFHGQDGDLQDHYPYIKLVRDLGYDVLALDYRGDGMSEGTTNDEEDTYRDGVAAVEELRRRAPSQPIIYYCESLGAAICTEVVLRSRPVALHIDCTFASVDLLVRDGAQMPLPGSYLTDVTYDTISKIGHVGVPLQIFHGAADDFIRPAHGVALYDAAAEPKEIWFVPGSDHGTDQIQKYGGEEYKARLKNFLDATCTNAAVTSPAP